MDTAKPPPSQAEESPVLDRPLPHTPKHVERNDGDYRKRQRLSDDGEENSLSPTANSPSHHSAQSSPQGSPPPETQASEIRIDFLDVQEAEQPRIDLILSDATSPADGVNTPDSDTPEADFFASYPFEESGCKNFDDAAQALLQLIEDNTKDLHVNIVEKLVGWLTSVYDVASIAPERCSREFLDKHTFWEAIGYCACALARRRTLDAGSFLPHSGLQELFVRLLQVVGSLSLLLLRVDLAEHERISKRRDSLKDNDAPLYRLHFSSWTKAFCALLGQSDLWRMLSRSYGCDPMDVKILATDNIVASSADFRQALSVFEQLARQPCSMANGYESISPSFQLLRSLLEVQYARGLLDDGCYKSVESFVASSYSIALPGLCNARSLGPSKMFLDRFRNTLHALVVELLRARCDFAIRLHASLHDTRMPEDGLTQTRNESISWAWRVFTITPFLMSTIPYVKHFGVELLTKFAVDCFNRFSAPPRSSLDLRYPWLGRLFHAENIIEHIFGPKSDAIAVSHSSPILSFIVSSGNLDKPQTHRLLSLIASNEQPSRVKAGLATVQHALRNTHTALPQMLHALSFYRNVSASSLSLNHLDFFHGLVVKVEQKKVFEQDKTVQGETAETIITSMQKVGALANGSQQQQGLNILRECLKVTLYAGLPESMVLVARLVESCVSRLGSQDPASTGSAHALALLIIANPTQSGPSIRALVPIRPLLQELDGCIHAMRSHPTQRWSQQELRPRIEIVLLKWDDADQAERQATEATIWQLMVGQDAIDDKARDLALDLMTVMSREGQKFSPNFLLRCIETQLPLLPAEFATEGLLRAYATLSNGCPEPEKRDLLDNFTKHLIRLYLEMSDGNLSALYMDASIQRLFHLTTDRDVNEVLAQHISLARLCMDRISHGDRTTGRAACYLRFLIHASIAFESRYLLQEVLLAEATSGDGTEATTLSLGIQDGLRQRIVMSALIKSGSKLSELIPVIVKELGTTAFRFSASGEELDLEDGAITLEQLTDRNPLVVHKIQPWEIDSPNDNSKCGRSFVEREVLCHFDQLYPWLERDDQAAMEVFSLLCSVPHPRAIRQAFFEDEMSTDQHFPAKYPLKTMYSMTVARAVLPETLKLGESGQMRIRSRIRVLCDLLPWRESPYDPRLVASTAKTLAEYLIVCQTRDISDFYVEHAPSHMADLLDLMTQISNHHGGSDGADAVLSLEAASAVQACLFEGLRKSGAMCHAFCNQVGRSACYKTILSSGLTDIASVATSGLHAIACDDGIPKEVKDTVWDLILSTIKESILDPSPFRVLQGHVVDILVHSSAFRDVQRLHSLHAELLEILFRIDHTEQDHNSDADPRLETICAILHSCNDSLRKLDQVPDYGDVSSRIFTKFLFPRMDKDGVLQDSTKPAMNFSTRLHLYHLAYECAQGTESYQSLLNAVDELFVGDDLALGIYTGDERHLRSSSGLTGLINHGQTCYMNSLLQQLYMNTPFRNFVKEVAIVDEKRQKVLLALQVVFVHMEASHIHDISPLMLIEALDIDSTVQEDAHVFFTILIGKLEDDMPDPDTKRRFKDFFGGRNQEQTIGECGHVSAGVDEYVNLSLVVSGKSDIIESLQEYVEGSQLEGGDKFKCLACETQGKTSYVDARRRTRLEHIPDNLVFGLKRFRYETWDGGTKVNDYFQFPTELDMSPFTLKQLETPDQPIDEDVFELVGVVVHLGTLQFGHYWSYVKDQPMHTNGSGQWYRVEDIDTRFSNEEEVLRATCGGRHTDNNGVLRNFDSTDNAYILFYRRKVPQHSNASSPAPPTPQSTDSGRGPLKEWETNVLIANDVAVRASHLYHMAFQEFVWHLINRFINHPKEFKDAKDTLLPSVTGLAIRCFHHVVSSHQFINPKSKSFEDYLQSLINLATGSTDAAVLILKTLFSDAARPTVFCNNNVIVRRAGNRMVMHALQYLRDLDPQAYGFDDDGCTLIDFDRRCEGGMFLQALTALDILFRDLPDWTIWAQTLELMVDVAALGPQETFLVLNEGYLTTMLELLFYDASPWRCNQSYAKNLEKNAANVYALIDCVYGLMGTHVDLTDRHGETLGYLLADNKVLLCSADHNHLKMGMTKYWAPMSFLVWRLCDRHGPSNVLPLRQSSAGSIVALFLRDTSDTERAHFFLDSLDKLIRKTRDVGSIARVAATCCVDNIDGRMKVAIIEAMLSHWRETEDRDTVLAFLAYIFDTNSRAVLERLPSFMPSILESEDEVQAQYAKLLEVTIFNGPIVTTPPTDDSLGIDLIRLSIAQQLYTDCQTFIEHAYKKKMTRAHNELAISVFYASRSYLDRACRVEEGQQDVLPWNGSKNDQVIQDQSNVDGAIATQSNLDEVDGSQDANDCSTNSTDDPQAEMVKRSMLVPNAIKARATDLRALLTGRRDVGINTFILGWQDTSTIRIPSLWRRNQRRLPDDDEEDDDEDEDVDATDEDESEEEMSDLSDTEMECNMAGG